MDYYGPFTKQKGTYSNCRLFFLFLFFSLFLFLFIIFFFLSNARLLQISRKPLDIKLLNLNMLVRVKIFVSNFFFAPRSKSPPGAKKSKNKWPEWSGELSVSFNAKFYLKVPWTSALNLFQVNLLISIKWGSRRPQNWIWI